MYNTLISYCSQVQHRENHKNINSDNQASKYGSCPIKFNSHTVKIATST